MTTYIYQKDSMGVINLTFYSQKLWHSEKTFPKTSPDQKSWYHSAYEVVNPEVIPGISNALMTDDLRLFCEQDKVYKYLSDGDQITLPDGYGIKERKYRQRGEVNATERKEATIILPEKPDNSANGRPILFNVETGNAPSVTPVEPSESQEEIWNDVDQNYIRWNDQEIKLSDLIRDFEIRRR